MSISRKTFIKSLGIGSLGFIVSEHEPFNVSCLTSQPEKVYHKLQARGAMQLIRIPTHPHDHFAVKIFWKEYPLGYITAYEDMVPTNLMDTRVASEGIITEKKSKDEVSIGIWANLIVDKENQNTMLSEKRADAMENNYRKRRLFL